MSIRTALVALVAVCAGVTLTGCMTGERPTLVSAPLNEVTDPSALAVLERLNQADDAVFTATYEITPSTTGVPTEATVSVDEGRRRIEIGPVRYVVDGSTAETCVTTTGECVDFIDNARVSDLNITDEFWGDAFASRLRLDASRRVGFTSGRRLEIAGEPSACVDIPLPGVQSETANVTYCALDRGPLARYFGADVSIELTSFVLGDDPTV